jgi:hypothetical protein
MGFNTGRRNLIINGAMQVAQRGTSSSTNNYQSVDRWKMYGSGPTTTKSQQTLTSGSPYDEGFRYFARQANTSVSSSTTAYVYTAQQIEAQNIAGSGWNYTSTSSYVTLSFWVRSSLAGTYYAGLTTSDGTEYIRHKAFTLVADTWTKVTFTTAGNSNLTFNNDNGAGLFVEIVAYYGTDYTGGEEVDANDWYTRGGNLDAYYPNFAQNWANTASATFDVTGVQLEVGENASDFEHRSYGEELQLCSRYYQQLTYDGGSLVETGHQSGTSGAQASVHYPYGLMRAAPTITMPPSGQGQNLITFLKGNTGYPTTTGTTSAAKANTAQFLVDGTGYSGLDGAGNSTWLYTGSTGGSVTFKYDAEL